MINFIKELFEGKVDENVHRQFKRFSKGTFENRAAYELTNGKTIKIKTNFEFANDFARMLAETIKGKAKVTGGIITTKDLKQAGIEFSNIKQFAGVKTYQMDTEISKEILLKVMNDFPDAVFCFTFSTEYGGLKTKVKAPKSPKPGKGDEDDVKVDYCTFTTNDKEFLKEFSFDVKEDFKKLKATHDFVITELVVPKEYMNDFEKARVHARRKGKIIRKLDVDGKTSSKELNFEA